MPTTKYVAPARARVRGSSIGSFRRFTFLSVVVMAVALNGCQATAQGNGRGGAAGPYVVTGTITTTSGTPLTGVEVFADNTLFYDANITVHADANGKFRIELPVNAPGPWNIAGYVNLDYHGESYRLRLHPLLDEAVVASQGGVR